MLASQTARTTRRVAAAQISKHVRARRADHRDVSIGKAIRGRRLECKLSQTDLAGKIGVTFQQVQKYEKGVNRVGGGRLGRICEALNVPSSYFFGKQGEVTEGNGQSVLTALSQDRGALRFLEAYARAKDKPETQAAMRHLIALAELLAGDAE